MPNLLRTLLAVLLTAVLLPVVVGAGAATAAPGRENAAGAVTDAVQDAVTARQWGATAPAVPGDPASLQTPDGRRPGVLAWYVAWSTRAPFPVADADRVRATGAIPEITWEPWDPAAGVDQPAYALRRIASGAYDGYLRRWAAAVAGWGHPLRLRFAHEMNGTWYPWDQGVNGNRAGSYVAAWDHVRAVFDASGASNVTWVWSPNVPYPGSTPLSAVFPGDDVVDEVALDGYNWAGGQPGTTWTSFADVFGPGIAQLGRLSQRPVGIGEVGCPEVGGSKADWLAAMWRTLASWPQVRTLVWFDYDKEADWRIESSPASIDAFTAGLPGYLQG